MEDEKIKAYLNDQWQKLSLDDIENVAGGGSDNLTCEAVCPVGCGFVKVFDDLFDALSYVADTKSCPHCGYDKSRLIVKKG